MKNLQHCRDPGENGIEFHPGQPGSRNQPLDSNLVQIKLSKQNLSCSLSSLLVKSKKLLLLCLSSGTKKQ